MQYGHRGTEPALPTALYIHLPLLLLFIRAKNIVKRLAAWCIYRALGTYEDRAEIEYNLYVIQYAKQSTTNLHQAHYFIQ